MIPSAPLPAGRLGAWLDHVGAALEGRSDADVPCGDCAACCTSSQFVHVGPEEADALAHIPPVLLFPAPGLPAGNVVLGYDEAGRCPMLVDGRCSIYEHRPQACRMYDCRVFAATGVELHEPAKAAIDARVHRWRFDLEDGDEALVATLQHAAAEIRAEHPGAPATALAVQAVRVVIAERPS